jgi:hypothetical protein
VLRQQEQLLRARIRQTKDNLDLQQQLVGVEGQIQGIVKAAVDKERGQFGSLFQGPVLAPTDEQRKRVLGLPGPTPARLTADLAAQNRAFAQEQRDLARLRRRGAPTALINELQSQGPAGAEFVHSLANATGKALTAFIRQFSIREREINQAAQVDINAKVVNIRTSASATRNAGTARHVQAGRGRAAQTARDSGGDTFIIEGNLVIKANNPRELQTALRKKAKSGTAQRSGRNAGQNVGAG